MTVAPGALIDDDSPRWLAALERVPHDTYHLPGFVRNEAELVGGRAVAFVYDDGRDVLLVPLVIRPIQDSARVDAVSPYGYGGPVGSTTDESFWRAAFDVLIEALARRGAVACFLRLHPLLPAGVDAVTSYGTVQSHGQTVSIDLRQPEGEIVSKYRRDHRRQIRRAKASGAAVVVDDWALLSWFIELYRSTMVSINAKSYYVFPPSYFHGLRERLGDHIHLMTVRGGTETLGAGLFLECDGIVQYHLGAVRPDTHAKQPTKILLDATGRWAKSRGNAHLHLGGGVGAHDDSLFLFKAGFSDLRHVFRTLSIVVDEAAYAGLVLERLGRPDGGLDRTGFFPAYRQGAV